MIYVNISMNGSQSTPLRPGQPEQEEDALLELESDDDIWGDGSGGGGTGNGHRGNGGGGGAGSGGVGPVPQGSGVGGVQRTPAYLKARALIQAAGADQAFVSTPFHSSCFRPMMRLPADDAGQSVQCTCGNASELGLGKMPGRVHMLFLVFTEMFAHTVMSAAQRVLERIVQKHLVWSKGMLVLIGIEELA